MDNVKTRAPSHICTIDSAKQNNNHEAQDICTCCLVKTQHEPDIHAPPPDDTADAFTWVLARQFESLMLVSGVMWYPFYSMTLFIARAHIPFASHLGILILALDVCCFYGATALRLKTVIMTRRGKAALLLKHMAQIRRNQFDKNQSDYRSLLSAPFYCIMGALFFFLIQLMGFIIFCGPSPPKVPELWHANTFNFCVVLVSCSAATFVGRMTKFVIELGNPEICREEEMELVDEKV